MEMLTRDALLGGFVDACLADGFGGRDVDRILFEQLLGRVAANGEFVTVGRHGRADKDRHRSDSRQCA